LKRSYVVVDHRSSLEKMKMADSRIEPIWTSSLSMGLLVTEVDSLRKSVWGLVGGFVWVRIRNRMRPIDDSIKEFRRSVVGSMDEHYVQRIGDGR